MSCHRSASKRVRAATVLAGVAAVAAFPVASALAQSPAPAQSPGFPRGYDVQRIDSPNPIPNFHFGWGVASADFTGDGDQDLLSAQSDSFTAGEVFLFDGESGRHIDTLRPPEKNPRFRKKPPTAKPEDPLSPAFEEFAFVYAEKMADVGSCPGGESNKPCQLARVGPQDGIPEIIIGSRALHVGPQGQTGREEADGQAVDPQIGRGYVFDGKTRAVLKMIDMPVAERNTGQGLPGQPGPAFARSMVSPSGLAPCAGSAANANNAGVARCDDLTPADALGDMDGRANSTDPAVAATARADIIVTARGYRETNIRNQPNSSPGGSQCAPPTSPETSTVTCGSGRAWVYHGEDISGSSPLEILDGESNREVAGGSASVDGDSVETVGVLRDPFGQKVSQEFGGNVFRIGDVGRCTAPTTNPPTPLVNPTSFRCTTSTYIPDGVPEIAIADRTVDYPLPNPNTQETPDVGATYVYDGKTGGLLTVYTHPQPQPSGQFSDGFNAGMATGDLGNTSLPDLLQGAPTQSVRHAGDGRMYVLNGEATTGRGRQFSVLDDPTPNPGGNFGSSQTGVGDIAPGAANPANEVLVGSFAPFSVNTEFVTGQLINDAHFMNPNTERVLQTIPDPDQAPGSGFGVGITPMGDLNEDGFLDFTISAYESDAPPNGGPSVGRVFIFRSNNRTAALTAGENIVRPTALRPGSCANDTLGTNRSDKLRGTRMGDRIFGFKGKDSIESFGGGDCLNGGTGADRVEGDGGKDRLLGGAANDKLVGGTGNDRLFGGAGNDRLAGSKGRDLLAGGGGNDVLRGSKGDRLFGETGNDRLIVGKDVRKVDAGPGKDVIDIANGEKDEVNCGLGKDRVLADRGDTLEGCERVKRTRRRG